LTTKKPKPPIPAPPDVFIYVRGNGAPVKDPEAWRRRSWLRRLFSTS
jgi:hypothetical protein